MNNHQKILQLLVEAESAGVLYSVKEGWKEGDFEIDFTFTHQIDGNRNVHEGVTLVIDESYDEDDYEFILQLIHQAKEERKEEERRNKVRKEVLAKLTAEEKELLGL